MKISRSSRVSFCDSRLSPMRMRVRAWSSRTRPWTPTLHVYPSRGWGSFDSRSDNPFRPHRSNQSIGYQAQSCMTESTHINSLTPHPRGCRSPSSTRFRSSFPHFIVDPARRVDERSRVSPLSHHSDHSVGCFELLNRMLEKKTCKLQVALEGWVIPLPLFAEPTSRGITPR